MPPATERDLRLDFFRGIALWLIFVDHIPTNIVNWITLRNYGFSDAAEAFVFISGYAAAFVYGRAMRERGFVVAALRILKRVWQLYIAHIFLFIIFFAQIAYVARTFENPLFAEEMNIVELIKQPDVVLPQAMLLRFNPANMDILPVYILLLLGFPVLLWLLVRTPALALLASAALYLLARIFGWNMPLYPGGTWIINPFYWQLLFAVGAWCGLYATERLGKALGSPIIFAIAFANLLFAFFIVRSWYWPQLDALIPTWLHDFMHAHIYPIDKTNLDMVRLTHFLALAVVTVWLVPRHWSAFRSPFLRPAILCGQHSLPVFCLGIFLSFAGHFVIAEISGRVATQIIVSITGVVLMAAVAALIAWYQNTEKRSVGARGSPPDADIAGGNV